MILMSGFCVTNRLECISNYNTVHYCLILMLKNVILTDKYLFTQHKICCAEFMEFKSFCCIKKTLPTYELFSIQ